MPFDPQTLSLYPTDPGVYLMKDLAGRVLYIGKAKNLRTRLKSYYSDTITERPTLQHLTEQIETIDTIIVFTEKEALILENQLIKQHLPKYNILLKDDKTFISLALTDHEWPMLRLVRNKGAPPKKGSHFGPYTSAYAARQIHDLLSRLFPLRQCSDTELMNRERPCLLYDIKRCIAPCVGKCTKEEYFSHVESAKKLLQGKSKELLRDLKLQMERASEHLLYEKAQSLLNLIQQIEHVTQVQHVDNPEVVDCDVIGLYREADAILIALLLFREGKLTASEHFSFHFIASTDSEIIESFLLQHYHPPLSQHLFLPCEIPHLTILSELLQTTLLTPQKGKKKELITMANRNAQALFVREQDTRSLREKMLLDLQETLHLTRFPRRIACFDTSNISGTDPVASLAYFVNGEKSPSHTRLFKIRGTDTADDYTALRQVLLRHFTREKEKNDFSDLLIVDGGKGQLNLALSVFDELGIASIDTIAVTKEEARHDKGLTQEKIYLPHLKDPLLIDPRSPLLFLLQRIRDTAHAQAIRYHRKKRSQRTISSELDTIRGIGPKKKKILLQHFGSVKALKNASDEDLEGVSLLTRRDREILRQWIESE